MKLYALQLNFVCLLLLHFASISGAENIDEDNGDDIERFCYPNAHKNTRKSCECSNVSAGPWGMRAVQIDCSYKDFKSTDTSEILPLYIDILDLSWNALDRVPAFASDSLHLLNVMHNNITSVSANNFAKVSNLRELYLSWNSIQNIEAHAFDGLAHLQILDLSHNNLQLLPMSIFAPLLVLSTLSLSWNRQFNKTNNKGLSVETPAVFEGYESLGIHPRLNILKLEACNLSALTIPAKATLKELHLRRNSFTHIPSNLPQTLERLDISENLLDSLILADTLYLTNVSELYLEDMPRLHRVASAALEPLKVLQKISFQNSRQLSEFDGHAFGTTPSSVLKTIIFRGTTMRSFNITLAPIFRQLTELDLNGLPLYCDCELIWVKELPIETNGRCFKPSRLRGMLLSNAPKTEFSCDTWPRWVYGIITLGLIALFSAGIYLIVMGLRPHRGVTLRRKVGAGSPYARVTIEPNRQENNY